MARFFSYLFLALCLLIISSCTSSRDAPRATDTTKRVGLLLGFTGSISDLIPPIASSAELAVREVSASGLFMDGNPVEVLRGDTTCDDAEVAVRSAEALVSRDIIGIIGADCSDASYNITTRVAVPNDLLIISPLSSSPSLTDFSDAGLFFRMSPSDSRTGSVLADITRARNIDRVAVTYIDNRYGIGLARSFSDSFESLGGEITSFVPHTNEQTDYIDEVQQLGSGSATHLAIFGYTNSGGGEILRHALRTQKFTKFIMSDGLAQESHLGDLYWNVELFGILPGAESELLRRFRRHASSSGLTDVDASWVAESYDAASVLLLSLHASYLSGKPASSHVLDITNPPGQKIYAGELPRALRILSAGGEIDYEGGSTVTLTPAGDAYSSFEEWELRDGKMVPVGDR